MLNKRYREFHKIFILFAFLIVVAGVFTFAYTNNYYDYAEFGAEYGEAPQFYGYYGDEYGHNYGYEVGGSYPYNTTYEQFGPGEPSPWTYEPIIPLTPNVVTQAWRIQSNAGFSAQMVDNRFAAWQLY